MEKIKRSDAIEEILNHVIDDPDCDEILYYVLKEGCEGLDDYSLEALTHEYNLRFAEDYDNPEFEVVED